MPHSKLIETDSLPTHLAKCCARVNAIGADASGDTFLMISYLAEALVKTIAVVLQVGLRERAPTHAYRIAYELVRADGLGTWETAIRDCTSEPLTGFMSPDCNELVAWCAKRRTRSEDEWYRQAKLKALGILRELGSAEEPSTRPQTIRELLSNLVQIRNKTKAHGAVGPDFFAFANESYLHVIRELLAHCPLRDWEWLHLSTREKSNVRAILLLGEGPRHLRDADAIRYKPTKPGVHFVPKGKARAFYCADLIKSNREYNKFELPNGGYDGRGHAEFLDYGDGQTAKVDIGIFVAPPVLPPASETEGTDALDVQGSLWANLPSLPAGYVERPRLQRELREKLLDHNHAIVTLHGRGGVGKTMLALNGAHQITQDEPPRFETILWFSARDVDLRPSGPSFVRPAVVDLDDIAKIYGKLTQGASSLENLAQGLQGKPGQSNSTLFIFDNFETMASIADLHRFLDTHTHLPNKTLITSRERAFKADYPIEVKGMEFDEAREMLKAVARELNIEGLASDETLKSVFENTEGHAYLMRVVMGEIAIEGRYVPPRQLVSKRMDIVDAVFERSFEKLSDAGRSVFLVVANWKSAVPALALIVVLGDLDFDVEAGIDECLRLSLINRDYLLDGQPCYSAPLLARLFGQKKFIGDPDKLILQSHLDTIRRFGVVDVHSLHRYKQQDLTEQFINWCCDPANVAAGTDEKEKLDRILASLAELWPAGWLALARYRQAKAASSTDIQNALRRAVEEMPENKDAWLARAEYARTIGDESTQISSLLSAVDADPNDRKLVSDVAGDVTRYITEHSEDIPPRHRGVYLAAIRGHLERIAGDLNADELSRLAWLFLLENNSAQARHYAEEGLKKDKDSIYCKRILVKLGKQTGRTPSSNAVSRKPTRRKP
jgi:tetratricopeptide (TPR) repeat protein